MQNQDLPGHVKVEIGLITTPNPQISAAEENCFRTRKEKKRRKKKEKKRKKRKAKNKKGDAKTITLQGNISRACVYSTERLEESYTTALSGPFLGLELPLLLGLGAPVLIGRRTCS